VKARLPFYLAILLTSWAVICRGRVRNGTGASVVKQVKLWLNMLIYDMICVTAQSSPCNQATCKPPFACL
jgi:hypothetical protein